MTVKVWKLSNISSSFLPYCTVENVESIERGDRFTYLNYENGNWTEYDNEIYKFEEV